MKGGDKAENELRNCSFSDAPPAASPVPLLRGRSPGSQVLICRLPIRPPFPYILGGDYSQWPTGKSTLAYRCGGSTGIGLNSSPVSRLTRLQADRNLKAVRTLTQACSTRQKSCSSKKPKITNRFQNSCLPFDLSALFKL